MKLILDVKLEDVGDAYNTPAGATVDLYTFDASGAAGAECFFATATIDGWKADGRASQPLVTKISDAI